MIEGIVISCRNGLFTVACSGISIRCKAATRLRKNGVTVLVGDRVSCVDNGDRTGFLTEVFTRRNSFIRPSVANIDVFAIVASVHEPELDLFNIDKLICMAEASEVQPLLVFNKTDTGDPAGLAALYRSCGYPVFETRANDASGTEELLKYLAGKVAVFAGASGVGKSSLLNCLRKGEEDVETGSLSEKIARGKNTTRHTELYDLHNGGYLADTPGFTMLDFEKNNFLTLPQLLPSFPEFIGFATACRYRDCTHTKEEGCAVRAAVGNGTIAESRHQSYCKLYDILKAKPSYRK